MKQHFSFLVTFVAAMLFSCSQGGSVEETKHESNKFIGSWVQPNPINEKEVQGFMLKENGESESINMATLLYKKWWADSGKITLVCESKGNGMSFLDTSVYEVVRVDDSSLVLKRGDYTDSYKKSK